MGTNVKGPRVDHGVDLENILQPGAFQFQDIGYEAIEDPAALPDGAELRLGYCCPRTGKECGGILIGKGIKPQRGGAATWKWDGNVIAPTLDPSINCRGGCGWHGWLRAGEFQEC